MAIERHKPHRVTVAALCVTDRAGVQPRPQVKPAPTDFGLQPNSHTQPWYAVEWSLFPCNYMYSAIMALHVITLYPRKYIDYSFFNYWGGRLSWPSLLTHSGQFTHRVVTGQP